MAFHAGVFEFLAQRGELERVTHVSSVSGGSLFVGLVFKLSGYHWPSSAEYLNEALPGIRKHLCNEDLGLRALARLLLPTNWKFILSRANIIAQTITKSWGIEVSLADLPQVPEWSINATTAETGRRFRFKRDGCGDYELGYADATSFLLAEAIATSAAFPGLIGPFVVNAVEHEWKKRPKWEADASEARVAEPPSTRLHLYDGGVYDNLGVEPLFDSGQIKLKVEGNPVLLVSDAGSPFVSGFRISPLNPWRLRRVLDIVMDQVHALRVRSLMALFLGNQGAGALVASGTDAMRILLEAKIDTTNCIYLPSYLVKRAASYPTDLSQMTSENFELLARHGRETAEVLNVAFAYLGDSPS